MLAIENVTCTYGNRLVFEGVNAALEPGALVILHGSNGTGKTSLLQMVAGVKQPSQGAVLWNENPIYDAIQKGDLTLNYVAHANAIKPDLTVYENLAFWAKLKGEEERIPMALSSLSLDNLSNRYCRELSEGWRKRVALAILLSCPAALWVLDEPYNNLDSKISGVLDNMLVEHCQNGGIAVVSSHTFIPLEFASKLNIADYNPKKT